MEKLIASELYTSPTSDIPAYAIFRRPLLLTRRQRNGKRVRVKSFRACRRVSNSGFRSLKACSRLSIESRSFRACLFFEKHRKRIQTCSESSKRPDRTTNPKACSRRRRRRRRHHLGAFGGNLRPFGGHLGTIFDTSW